MLGWTATAALGHAACACTLTAHCVPCMPCRYLAQKLVVLQKEVAAGQCASHNTSGACLHGKARVL